jgi:hypothetical protein
MKTTTNLLLTLCSVCFFTYTKAQYLKVQGLVKDENGSPVKVEYTLKNIAAKLESGKSSKVNLKVFFSGAYSITFCKDGYESKTVYFSTNVAPERIQDFNLNVVMHKSQSQKYPAGFSNSAQIASVYYDGITRAVCFATEK